MIMQARVFAFCALTIPAISTHATAKTCTYEIAEDSAKLEWKGYKFTDKVGVPGTFDRISWTQNRQATSLKQLIESIDFSVDVSSINSKDKGRDATLTTKFFGATTDKNAIKGDVKTFDLDKKTATAALTMNGVTKAIPFSVAAQDKTLTWTASIDLTDQFNMATAVAALAEACNALHIGKDGKSVTWDEVGLTVTAAYKETCQ